MGEAGDLILNNRRSPIKIKELRIRGCLPPSAPCRAAYNLNQRLEEVVKLFHTVALDTERYAPLPGVSLNTFI